MSATSFGSASGTLLKRAGGESSFTRAFCVLSGEAIVEYENYEDAAQGIRPRARSEIIGVSPWDGRNPRFRSEYGFIYMGFDGAAHYAIAPNEREQRRWIGAMRAALQRVLQGDPDAPPSPPRAALTEPPGPGSPPRPSSPAFDEGCESGSQGWPRDAVPLHIPMLLHSGYSEVRELISPGLIIEERSL